MPKANNDTRDMSKVQDFWTERGKMGACGGTNDFIAQKLEEDTLISHVGENSLVCDIGCGDGNLLFQLHNQKKCQGLGLDYSTSFIEQCNAKNEYDTLRFQQHDITKSVDSFGQFDVVISKRCLINLQDLKVQKAAFGKIVDLLKPNGFYFMVESFEDGNDKLNEIRIPLGLEPMGTPWHNLFFKLDDVKAFEQEFPVTLEEVSHFSSTYYYLSRIVNAKIAHNKNENPQYDSDINKVALDLPPYGEFGATKLLIWKKNV